ncbi:MAG: GAF domain-containing protein [Anaerolineae bacterium]
MEAPSATDEPSPLKSRLEKIVLSHHFWLVVAMLLSSILLHYSAQERPFFTGLFAESSSHLSRHALERILFILPVSYAAFMFGGIGGLITLLISLVAMLPRVFFASPYPADAFMETVAVALVGGLICWLVTIRDREKRLRQNAIGRLEAVGAVSDVVIQSLDLDQILDGALDKLVEILGVERRGGMFLVNQEAGELFLVAHRDLPQELALLEDRIKVGECLCGRVAETGDVLVSDEGPDDPRHTRACFAQQYAHVGMPLRARDRVVGVLFLYATRGHQYSASDLHVLTTIANQLGPAVENALLHQDLARQLEREKRLNEVAQKITSELELDKVLPTVVQIAEELVGADGGVIALLDEERDLIAYPYLHNMPQELAEVTVPRGEGLAGQVMTRGCPVVIEDYANYPEAVEPFARAGLASVAAVPIVTGDRVFGVLLVFSLNERRGFSERDMALIEGVGRQAGIAIENAHLYENLRSYARQITSATEEERKRIARELHDDTAQNLAYLSRHLDWLTAFGEGLPEPTVQRLEQLRELASSTLQGVRRFSQALRPPALDDLGLLPALEGLTGELSKRNEIETELKVLGNQRRLSAETELVLFRITQEALRNVEKHSGASTVIVTVDFSDTGVGIIVKDNGIGFHLPEPMGDLAQLGKLGLVGIQERAELLGGTLAVQSKEDHGTIVMVNVPA